MASSGDPHREVDPVVVGVDGSEHSKRALAWGARYAALTGAPLTVMAVWHPPLNYGWTGPTAPDRDPEADTRQMLEREAGEVLGAERPASVSLEVVQGPPGKVLVEASQHASAVVVGSRGRGEFAGRLLGSVSSHVSAHARCPVVVVHDRSGQ
jgi:nucleotide-binding universal stress UspA family protein